MKRTDYLGGEECGARIMTHADVALDERSSVQQVVQVLDEEDAVDDPVLCP